MRPITDADPRFVQNLPHFRYDLRLVFVFYLLKVSNDHHFKDVKTDLHLFQSSTFVDHSPDLPDRLTVCKVIIDVLHAYVVKLTIVEIHIGSLSTDHSHRFDVRRTTPIQ